MACPPPVRPDTPRLKFQFQHLERNKRRTALRTLFDDLPAYSLDDRKTVVCRIEQIVFIYGQHPKPLKHYKNARNPKDIAVWTRAVHRQSTELATLLRACPYGENWFPAHVLIELDALAKRHNPNAGRKPKSGGAPPKGFDWLVANLAAFYSERTGRPAGRSRHSETGAASGPLVRVVQAVCELIHVSKTGEAIAQTIARLPDKT